MCDKSLDRSALVDHFRRITVWKRRGAYAPNKPLLLLWMLARVARGEPRLANFNREVEPALKKLLAQFGTRRSWPHYPFWRLRNDGIWEVPGGPLPETSSGNVQLRALRGANRDGGFRVAIQRALLHEPTLVDELAMMLLHRHFPASMYGSILTAVGYRSDQLPHATVPSFFQREVLSAYDHRCAVCDFSLEVNGAPVALSAAHIQWPFAGGPHVVQNGLALCSTHHTTWDRGLMTLKRRNSECLILVDTAGSLSTQFRRLHGELLRPPEDALLMPDPNYTEWHRLNVFRG